ncbi:hypothetical protein FGIG_03311 [Fasciola gigantica]|uniref:Rab-GAP TBC domain-containing protein n=1 Tax=Fasciola gigantica TaxID=46835 RepID=A0A504YD08_FASGI|nr:hypothetical protein FGIG_03311 [Fasciola gigantica]
MDGRTSARIACVQKFSHSPDTNYHLSGTGNASEGTVAAARGYYCGTRTTSWSARRERWETYGFVDPGWCIMWSTTGNIKATGKETATHGKPCAVSGFRSSRFVHFASDVDGSRNKTSSCKAKVGELVEEARRKDPSLPTLSKPKNTDYHVDAFGFKHSYSDDAVVLHFVCRHLRDFYARQLSYEDEAAAQWTEILKQPNRELSRSELKYLCRAGVPPIHRGGIWRMLIHGEMKPVITEKGPHYYNRLISEISESKIATRYRKQISLDLMRTMPNNVLFDGIDAPGIQKLQEILQAYSIHNPDIGYCQGMNFLVAVALIFLNKEDAFWCLTAILEKYLPEKYFNCGLINAQVDQLVLKDLLASKLPKLSEHIRNMEIDISAITLNWFLAVFYDSVPFETLIRIWDVFLLEGSKCLFRFALALLKRNEDMLLLQTDTISFWKCLKSATRMTYDAESLVQTAYEELQPFASRSTINSLQAHHYEILSKELSEKRRLWQNVHKEFDEEAGDDVRVVMKRKKTNVEPSCIQAAMAFDKDSVWICHGGRLCTKMSTVEVQDCRMKHMMLDLDDRVSCMRKLTNDVILFGMMASKICAYSTESKQVLWQLAVHDCVTDLAVVRWDIEDTNKVFAGLSNGELVVIENAGSEHPQDSVYVFPIGFLRVSSILLVDDQIWCASGNGVHIFNTATLDFQGHFVISNNALDLILALKLGKHGVWLAVRGSSLIELWDPKTLTRLLLFNTFSEMYVNRRELSVVLSKQKRVPKAFCQQDKFNLKDTEASTVFLPPKAIDKHETMSPMPRMNRRRTSCYSAISTDLSDKLAQKAYEEEEILPPENTIDRMSVTETKVFTQAEEFDSTDAVDLNDEQLKLADSQQLKKHRTEEIQRKTIGSDGEEVLRDSSELPPSPSSKVTKSRFSTMIETILEDDTSEERLDKVSCAVISDSGRSSPLGETSSTNQRIPSVMIESITPTTKDFAVSGDWQSTTPPNSVQKNIHRDDGVGQLALVLQNSPSHVQNLIQKSESIASSPSTGIHDMHSSTSDDGCPIFPCSTMPFRSLRDDVRVVEQSTDKSLRFQLFAIARNKVSETAIRILLSHKNHNDDKCIISCATFFDDDDAVLRWQKWTVEPLIWTNQPIFFYDPSSQIVQLPSYMMNTMTIRKEARRRITVAT